MIRYVLALTLLASCAQTKKTGTAEAEKPNVCDAAALVDGANYVPYGRIVWNTLLTATPNQSATFYTKLFGWKTKRIDANSVMVLEKNVPFANIRKITNDAGKPNWSPSIGVKNLEETIALIEKNGGKKIRNIIELGPKVGRVIGVEDQQGDSFTLQQMPDGQNFTRRATIYWNELHATQSDKTLEFYKNVFGWEACTTKLNETVHYTRFVHEGFRVAGFYGHTELLTTDVRQRWTPHIRVSDIDALAAKAVKLKAKAVIPVSEVPGIGRFATFTDPQGASFTMFQPNLNFQ